MSAQEALSSGLVSKVFPPDTLIEEAVKLGERISGFSKIAVARRQSMQQNSFPSMKVYV